MIFPPTHCATNERIGLIPPVPRSKSGIRDYDEESCGWIEMMKCMRKAGVQIEALIEYVTLFRQGDDTADAGRPFWWSSGISWWTAWRTMQASWTG